MNWVFATNSDFQFPISVEPNVVDIRYFKLWTLLDWIFKVWNIKRIYIIREQGYSDTKTYVCDKSSIPLMAVRSKHEKPNSKVSSYCILIWPKHGKWAELINQRKWDCLYIDWVLSI